MYAYHFEQTLLDIQTRAFEQHPWLASDDYSACCMTDNSVGGNPIIWVNEDFEKMTGYSREEMMGKNCRFLQGECTNPESVKSIKQSMSRGEEIEIELLNYRKNGIPFWNKFKLVPIFASSNNSNGEDKKVTHFISVQLSFVLFKEMGQNYKEWDPFMVGTWLDSIALGNFSKKFLEEKIGGSSINDLTYERLRSFGFNSEQVDAYENGLSELKLRAEKVVRKSVSFESTSPPLGSPLMMSVSSPSPVSSPRNSRKISSNVAIKCLREDQVYIYAIKRTTKLSAFLKSLKLNLKQNYVIQLAGSAKIATESEWADAVSFTEETVIAHLLKRDQPTSPVVSSRGFGNSSSFNSWNPLDSSMEFLLRSPSSSSSDTSGSQEIDENNDFFDVLTPRLEVEMLLNKASLLKKALKKSSLDSFEFAVKTMKYFRTNGKLKELVSWAIQFEVEGKESNLWFKNTNFPVKILSCAFQTPSAIKFLKGILQNTIRNLSKAGDLEIETGDKIAESSEFISNEINDLLSLFFSSINRCPLEIREIFGVMMQLLSEEVPLNEAREITLNIFFQRFIIPAITDPSFLGIKEEIVKRRQPFRVFSQVLESISKAGNETEKIQIVNQLMEINRPRLLDFMKKLTDIKVLQMLREVVDASLEGGEKERENSRAELEEFLRGQLKSE
eukprot:TRINITY_DN2734_c0_g1_i2.p1 TRINITY_DN2734_c0_g1~~TRINITY_DN2734_c0_g1_i2.p1  ORF type:complete len:671 (+),score=247.72 TRINITY_DN2734_c0_g1_i2:914-2926(+)